MTRPYSNLRKKMKPEARNKAADKTKAFLDAMHLQEFIKTSPSGTGCRRKFGMSVTSF